MTAAGCAPIVGALAVDSAGRRAAPTFLAVVLAVTSAGLMAGCGGESERDVRVTIVDERDRPIAGAVLYVEAWDDSGPFAFLTGTSGGAGVVPDTAREPLKIAWRPGARLAMAVFASGHEPAVVRNPDGRVLSDGALIALRAARPPADGSPADGSPAGSPADELPVASLFLPFEDHPDLAEELRLPAHDDLRAALRAAYEVLTPGGRPPTAAEERKIATLDAMN